MSLEKGLEGARLRGDREFHYDDCGNENKKDLLRYILVLAFESIQDPGELEINLGTPLEALLYRCGADV